MSKPSKKNELWKAYGKFHRQDHETQILYGLANVMREFNCGYEETLRMPIPLFLKLNEILAKEHNEMKKKMK